MDKIEVREKEQDKIVFFTGDIGEYIRFMSIHTDERAFLVFETNKQLIPGTRSRSLHKKIHDLAGEKLDEECMKLASEHDYKVGEAVPTESYNLKESGIEGLIHVISPKYHEKANRDTAMENVGKCCYSALEQVKEKHCNKVIFSPIHMNKKIRGMREETEAGAMMSAVTQWLEKNSEYKIKIMFCCEDEIEKGRYEKAYKRAIEHIQIGEDDIALVLEGGGAKGAFQLGAWEVLNEKGITSKIKGISGTSVGAINTLLFLAPIKDNEKRKFWRNFEQSALTKDRSQEKLRNLVEGLLQKASHNWSDILDKKYVFSTIYQIGGHDRYERWRKDDIAHIGDLICGSAAHPVLFKSQKYKVKVLDGGTPKVITLKL